MRMFAFGLFGLAIRKVGLPIHVFAGRPVMLHIHRIDRGD